MTAVRLTHIGGPTTLIEVHGWRLLTDPTFDEPGGSYSFGWGTGSRKLAGPAVAANALPPLGCVRFPVTGPVHYSMTARDAVRLIGRLRPHTAIPVHYEGWRHFRESRAVMEREFAAAPPEVRDRIRWLSLGEAVEVGA